MFARTLAACATALLLAPFASAAIITNGGFETGSTDPGMFAPLGAVDTSISGWTVGQGSIDYIGTYWTHSEGNRSVDLNGLTQGSITQNLNTVAGQQYLVTFDMAGNPAGGDPVKMLTASAGDFTGTFSFNTTGTSLANMGWTSNSFVFTASSSTTLLTFTGDSTAANAAFGPALDNVAVTAIPEPATLAVMGFGLLGIGGYVRRRKLAAATA